MSGIYGNRGGRGWQPPPKQRAPHTQAEVLARQAAEINQATAMKAWSLLKEEGAESVVDLIQVNGVWMTPEDAER